MMKRDDFFIRDKFTLNMKKRAGDKIDKYSELSDQQLGSIVLYTTDMYADINSVLRGKEGDHGYSDDEIKYYRDRAKDITTALMQVPSTKDQTYYRGFANNLSKSKTQQIYASLQPGDTISDKAFSSFSTNPDQAKKFLDPGEDSNTLVILKSSKLKQVDFLSDSPEEEESLSLPNERFRVKSNKLVPDKEVGTNVRVIELEDLDDDPF